MVNAFTERQTDVRFLFVLSFFSLSAQEATKMLRVHHTRIRTHTHHRNQMGRQIQTSFKSAYEREHEREANEVRR